MATKTRVPAALRTMAIGSAPVSTFCCATKFGSAEMSSVK